MKTVNIIDIPITYTDQVTFISILDKQVRNQQQSFIITSNPEIVIIVNKNSYFIDDINKATHIVTKWIAEYFSSFTSDLFIGVGGSFDVIAGNVKRAPVFWQKLNLEWFYRLIKQPNRWRRMKALPRFAIQIIKRKVRGLAS